MVNAAERDFDTLHARGIPQSFGAFGEIAAWKCERLRPDTIVAVSVVVPLAIRSAAKACFRKDFFV